GVFLASDGQHIVQSRTALRDIYLTFFVVLAFALLLVDRAWASRRLRVGVSAERQRLGLESGATLPGFGPGVGIRWWRLAAMVTLGLSAGVKWSGLYFAAGFLVLSVLWDAYERRAAGIARWVLGTAGRAAAPAF